MPSDIHAYEQFASHLGERTVEMFFLSISDYLIFVVV